MEEDSTLYAEKGLEDAVSLQKANHLVHESVHPENIFATTFTRGQNLTEHLLATYAPKDYRKWLKGIEVKLPSVSLTGREFSIFIKREISADFGYIRATECDTQNNFNKSLWLFSYNDGYGLLTSNGLEAPYDISSDPDSSQLMFNVITSLGASLSYSEPQLDEGMYHRMRPIDLLTIIKRDLLKRKV